MKIKVSKILLESALIFQAKKDIRYYLNGICFKADRRVCSTDGHRAFIGSKHEGELKEDVILSVTKAPTKSYSYVEIDTDSGIVTYHDTFNIRVGVGLCEVIDGKFPDIDRVIPKETAPTDRIGFNASYLADVEKVARLFNPKWASVLFELNGHTNATVAKLTSYNGEEAKIIVMPMRID
jgi:DNA polymerase-3 subunit beta